jgi:hypothetical protein
LYEKRRRGMISRPAKKAWKNVDSQNPQEDLTVHEKITNIKLTSRDLEKVKDKTTRFIMNYLENNFFKFVIYFIKLGCNVHSQVQKLKKFREANNESENENQEENQTSEIDNNYAKAPRKKILSTGFNFAHTFNPSHPFGSYPQNMGGKGLFTNVGVKSRIIAVTSHLGDPNPSKNKTKLKEEDKYLQGLGLFNILMFLMKFPFSKLIELLVKSYNLDINILDIKKQNVLLHLINNYKEITSIAEESFPSTINQFLDYGVKINQNDKDNNSAFLLLSKIWVFDEMVKLSKMGANVNQINNIDSDTYDKKLLLDIYNEL